MPSVRFLNLPKVKQDRILAATAQELSEVDFEGLSINRVIRRAGISRGSFYQYFEDKEDLVGTLLGGYTAELEHRVVESLAASGGDIFLLVEDLFDFTIEFGTRPEHVDFCANLFGRQGPGGHGVMDRITAIHKRDVVDRLLPLMRFESTSLAPGEEQTDLIDMLIVLMRSAVATVFADIGRRPEATRRFQNQIRYIRHGILKQSGENHG